MHGKVTTPALAASRDSHPIGFWFVFWGEFAERACYYGVRTLLALFITQELGFTDANAATVIQVFMAAAYALPLIGGVIADRWLGRYLTIVLFSVPYIVGEAMLGLTHNPLMLYVSLAMLAIGVGAIKPNVAPLMARMYEEQGKHALMDRAFSYFYLAINIGGALTAYLLPPLRDHAGVRVALFLPAGLMTLALVIFAIGKRFYPIEDAASRAAARASKDSVHHQPVTAEERRRLTRMLLVFPLLVIFWLAYDQQPSTWVFFARDYVDLNLWPFSLTLAPDQMQAVNPFLIVVCTPIFNMLWGWVDRRRGRQTPARAKVFTGFWITIVSIGLMALAGFLSTPEHKVSIWLMLVANVVLCFGELCISMIGMQMAYMDAPAKYKSSITAVFYLTIFGGDALGGVYDQLWGRLSPGGYFGIQALMLVAAALIFYVISIRPDARRG